MDKTVAQISLRPTDRWSAIVEMPVLFCFSDITYCFQAGKQNASLFGKGNNRGTQAAMIAAKSLQPRNEQFHSGNMEVFGPP